MVSQAIDRGRAKHVRRLHELFVAGQLDLEHARGAQIRALVAESWQRSLAIGVNPNYEAVPDSSTGSGLAGLRAKSPLAPALPVIRRLLVEHAASSGVLVALVAADGTLLWVEGDRVACRQAEPMNFVAGADWSEQVAGTNAPGTALALDRELHINGSEHFSRVAQRWSCAAAPIHDSATGALLGAIDVTGGPEVGSLKTLGLVRATAVAVEKHLALLSLAQRQRDVSSIPATRFKVLGVDRPYSERVDDSGQVTAAALAPRHADILVLLRHHVDGLSADQLALMLDDKELDVGTVRAEVSRMRRVLPGVVGSRPYRLLQPVDSDLSLVLEALKTGDVAKALEHYGGALLPRSMSPAVARLRMELSSTVRGAVLGTGDLVLLRRWLHLPEGRDDRDGWRLLHDSSEVSSVGRARARGHLLALDLDLG